MAANQARSARSWDFLSFSGKGEYFLPACDAQVEPKEANNEETDSVSWLFIPVVEVDRDFATTGWTRASLGACSARVGGANKEGFVVHGKQSGPDDASLRVVGLTDGSFIVEIEDDRFVLAAQRPLFEDHLEAWAGRADSRSIDPPCEPEPKEKPVQWGVRLADGAVWSGYGSPSVDRLKVEVGSREGSVRVRVRWLDSASFVTFVYSDSDDGTSQKALIATSSLAFGRARSLGETVTIDRKSATCRVRDGRLEPELY
jgi:hypothetical protein